MDSRCLSARWADREHQEIGAYTLPKSIGHSGGLYCYIIVPYKENGDVNLDAMERLIDGVIESGADGVTCVASTTEGPYLTEQERFDVVEATCNVTAGRVPVNVGIGAFSTRQALHYADHATKAGASTFMVEMQTYLPGYKFQDAHNHYAEIAKNVSLPLRLYNIPHTTRVDMLPDQIAAMADIEGIDSVKDATGDPERVREIKQLCSDRFTLFSGRHHAVLKSYQFGAIGSELAFLPMFADDMVALHRALFNRDFETGSQIYAKLEPLFTAFKYYGVSQCIKRLSSWTNNDLGNPRMPLQPMNQHQSNHLRRVAAELAYL